MEPIDQRFSTSYRMRTYRGPCNRCGVKECDRGFYLDVTHGGCYGAEPPNANAIDHRWALCHACEQARLVYCERAHAVARARELAAHQGDDE